MKKLEPKDITIATLGSHSALQILKGAKDEGFRTLCICKPGTERIYKSYGVADEIVLIDNWDKFAGIDEKLSKQDAVIIPHGTFPAYLSPEMNKGMKSMYFGNKLVLDWEADRDMQRDWLHQAGLTQPRQFETPEDIDSPVIIKFSGAKGGRGYWFAENKEEFYRQKSKWEGKKDLTIQEYIIGVPFYIHYYQSPLTGELEIMSMDKRYESNVDALGRIPSHSQAGLGGIQPSYTVVGNISLVMRESLLVEAFEIGERVVEISKKLIGGKGLYGPFCLETVITPDLKVFVFEISARIVAGTNLFINGSPYSYLKYSEPMSTGRRIARDLKNALAQDKLSEIVD